MNHKELEEWSLKAAQWIHCNIHVRTRSFDEFSNRQQDGIDLLDEFDTLVADVEKICLDDYPLPFDAN